MDIGKLIDNSIKLNDFETIDKLIIKLIFSRNFDLAQQILSKILFFLPNSAKYLNYFSNLCKAKGEYEISKNYILKALNFNPDNPVYLGNYADLLFLLREYDNAEKIYLDLINKNKENKKAYIGLLNVYIIQYNYEKISALFEKCKKIFHNDNLIWQSFLFNIFSNSHQEYIKNIKEFYKICNNSTDKDISFKKNKKIKIGFVTADLRAHPVGYQMYELLGYLCSSTKYEVYIFYNNSVEDTVTKYYKSLENNWVNIFSLEDNKVLNLINANNINVLFDLSGLTELNRLNIFNYRVADVQASWCGWLTSSGASKIDYIVGDEYATPMSDKHKYFEKIYQLNIWNTLTKEIDLKNVEIINSKKFSKDVVLGVFTNPHKVNKKLLNTWCNILQSTDKNVKIFFKYSQFSNNEIKKRFLSFFSKHNIEIDRIIFEGNSIRKEFLEQYNNIDLALDTFPYNGGTTSFEASAMNVPILTKINDDFFFRCGESINSHLEKNFLIASSVEDYIKKAIELANNKNKLNQIRLELSDISPKSDLFNYKKHFEKFEEMIEKMLLI